MEETAPRHTHPLVQNIPNRVLLVSLQSLSYD